MIQVNVVYLFGWGVFCCSFVILCLLEDEEVQVIQQYQNWFSVKYLWVIFELGVHWSGNLTEKRENWGNSVENVTNFIFLKKKKMSMNSGIV